MPLDYWFQKPQPQPKPESTTLLGGITGIYDRRTAPVPAERHRRLVLIAGNIRRRLVHQRTELRNLSRAYLHEIFRAEKREETIADLRARVTELERALENKRAYSAGNFFQRWFGG